MKKILLSSAALLVAMGLAGAASAAVTTVALTANAYVALSTAVVNTAADYSLTAVAANAGFVKNALAVTTSANVLVGVQDQTVRFGVVAGSNKGRNVFTGTSDGGSVTQCGASTSGTTFADTLVVTASLKMDGTVLNGCAR